MIDLIKLIETSRTTTEADFTRWFQTVPAAASWNIISDYCLDNSNKQNDAFSFVVQLNHDTMANIADYIRRVAPSDLKASRTPSKGLVSYLTCPVTFSLSFVVERQSSFLKTYITAEAITDFLPQTRELIRIWAENVPTSADYWQTVETRLGTLEREISGRKPSLKLIRQLFLVAAFASTVMTMVQRAKSPITLRWISDRDAMFDRFEGLAFDLAFFFFLLARSGESAPPDLRRPSITFATPMMDGKTDYAEFVRLPDYLAGTLADLKLPQIMFTHAKFPPLFASVFIDSPNNAIIEILGTTERITSRRIGFNGKAAS